MKTKYFYLFGWFVSEESMEGIKFNLCYEKNNIFVK